MPKLKVALVASDGISVPEWVGEQLAEAGLDFTVKECVTREELAAVAGDADVVWVFGGSSVISAEALSDLQRCGAIIRTGTGTDNIPVEAATTMGILVATTPDAGNEAVAEHTVGLILAVLRQISMQDRLVHAGVWDRDRAWPRWLLQGQAIGIVGFGSIGRILAEKLRGFDSIILAYDPYIDPVVARQRGVHLVDLEELLRSSRVVSLHCPLTDETRHIIGRRELGMLPSDAVLINTARGPLIDEQALIEQLEDGNIAGVGLDVLEEEPLQNGHRLLDFDNVVITPHIAGYSDIFLDESWRLSVETILDLARGQWPMSCVNPEVSPRWPLQRASTSSGVVPS